MLAALTLAGAAVSGLAVYLYARRETKNYRLENVSLTIANGKGVAEKKQRQLKILHLSDLHLIEPESHKIDFLQKITDDDYDLVFLTGDIFEDYSGLRYASKLLAKMPKLGAFAVLGNHDYFAYTMIHKTIGRIWRRFRHPKQRRDVRPIISSLEFAGIQVLRDEICNFNRHGFSLVGIDYPTIAPARLEELVAAAPEKHLLMALFHVPYKLDVISQAGVHLAFGGHTHGGQVRLPGIGALITDSELERHEAYGLTSRDQTIFHISRGLGADPRSNFRLFCPPAATVITVDY